MLILSYFNINFGLTDIHIGTILRVAKKICLRSVVFIV